MEKRLLYTVFGQLQNALDYITQTKSNFMQFLDIVIFPQVAKQVGFKEGIACLRFGAGMLVLLQGGAAGCCLRMLLSQWCALWGGHADAAAGGCCRVLQASKTYPSPHRNTMALKDELVREARPKKCLTLLLKP